VDTPVYSLLEPVGGSALVVIGEGNREAVGVLRSLLRKVRPTLLSPVW
jgi:hypothetical protein